MRPSRYVIPLALLAVVSLSGCSAITDFVRNEGESHFDDGAALFDSGVMTTSEAPWLPLDATEITVRESTKPDAATAVIGFTSASEVVGCTATERLSMPAYEVEWGPGGERIAKQATVQSCGDWVFIATGDGWFGWAPSAPGEKSAT